MSKLITDSLESLDGLTTVNLVDFAGFVPKVNAATDKSVEVDLTNLTNATTRTITMPDSNVTLVDYQTTTLALGGDFGVGEDVKITKIGDIVTVTAMDVLTFASATTATSAAGVIPAAYRPSLETKTVYEVSTVAGIEKVNVTPAGTITLSFFNWDGTLNSKAGAPRFTISYNV